VHIAGRLALQSDWASSNVASSEHISAKFGYHGCDIVVREICERSFLADFVDDLPMGALVRLRLPGTGTMLARIEESQHGKLFARFINPVGTARLRKTIGLGLDGAFAQAA
jgi:hypothetical protein